MLSMDQLRLSHQAITNDAHRLRHAVQTQIEALATELKITLAVPIESRIKSLESLEEKLKRKDIPLDVIEDLDDLIGVRAILLFQRDVDTLCAGISRAFGVISEEDTKSRLRDTQFGYQSKHFIVRLPDSWLEVPTMRGLDRFKAEIQVRTLAQHSWASASHKLQYKQELSVPEPVRRAIHRVSALLETVDLEFERVLDERDAYIAENAREMVPSEVLNVDLLHSAMRRFLPEKHIKVQDGGEALLNELRQFEISTVKQFENLVSAHLSKALQSNLAHLKRARTSLKKMQSFDESSNPHLVEMQKRYESGVYFSGDGLVRLMLRDRHGDKYAKWLKERTNKKAHTPN